MKRKLGILIVNLVLLLFSAVVIEVGALVLHVRPGAIDPSLGVGPKGGRQVFPRYYHVANDERGFDIARGAKPGKFSFNEGAYEVWSNPLGCLDRNERFDGDYALLLGDSFTWGYAPYEDKWGTRLEQSLHFPIAKCGVVHTGQRHQLSKGKDLVAQIGHAPRLVVVAHFWNDPHDDLLYPETTVVNGYVMDQASLKNGAIVRKTRPELEVELRDSLAKATNGEPGLVPWVRRRSVIVAGLHRVAAGAAAGRTEGFGGEDEAAVDGADPGPNRAAIAAIKAWTDALGAQLFFVLIPRREMTKDYYASLRPFLDAHQIAYLDLYEPTLARPDHGKSLYWKYDQHLNVEGNRVTAELVDAEIKRRFGPLLAAPAPTP